MGTRMSFLTRIHNFLADKKITEQILAKANSADSSTVFNYQHEIWTSGCQIRGLSNSLRIKLCLKFLRRCVVSTQWRRKMPSSGMWRRADIVWTDVSEVVRYSETSVHTRSTWCHIPEDGILHSHCRENLKSYIKCIYSVHCIWGSHRGDCEWYLLSSGI
jgi:hypothetical protein